MKLTKRGKTWWMDGWRNGRRIRRSLGTDDEELAKYKLGEYVRRWSGVGSGAKFKELAKNYKDRGIARREELYVEKLEAFFQDMPTTQTAAKFVQRFAKNSTKRRYLTTLKAILNYGYKSGEIDKVPYIEMPPDEGGRTRALNDAEKKALRDAATGDLAHLLPLVTFMLATGVGTGNALDLQWEDFDPVNECFQVTRYKGKKKIVRRVYVLPEIMKVIGPVGSGHVFRKGGKPMAGPNEGNRYKEAYADLRELKERAKVRDFRPYDMRHTFGTDANEKGVDPITLANIMGHASLTTTRRYTHPKSDHLKEAMRKVLK
jgi:integrase